MRSLRLAIPCLLALTLLPNCSKKNSTTGPRDPGPAAALVAQANASLGAIIAAMISGPDPQRPDDIDFREPYDLYKQALVADPGNRDAMFGVSVLGIVSLTSDPALNAAFDEWSAYLASNVPFQAGPSPGPLGVPLRFGRARDVLGLPYEALPRTQVSLVRGTLGTPPPQLSDVQGILETSALPRLTQALSYLEVVAADPSYQFIVTPQMQGDPGADPLEVDRTDILALRAGCGLLAALCDMAVAYDVSFASYDSLGLIGAFTPGSGWMALRANGASRLLHARTSILGAAADGVACINSLTTEMDNQDDDIIKLDPGSFTPEAADSLRQTFENVQYALTNGYLVTADWDGDAGTPEVTLEIQPTALFDNPVTDWKAMLPGYVPSALRRPGQISYTGGYGTIPIQVTAGTSGYYSGVWTIYFSNGNGSEYGYGDAEITSALQTPVHDRYKLVAGNANWAGEYSASGSFYGNLSAGTQQVQADYWEYYSVALTQVFVPTLTWTASDFAQWIWPDPTFNGLIPGVTSTAQLENLFGFTAGNWQQTIVLDWTGSGAPQP